MYRANRTRYYTRARKTDFNFSERDLKARQKELRRIEDALEEEKDWIRAMNQYDGKMSEQFRDARLRALDAIQEAIEAVGDLRRVGFKESQ